MRFQMSHKDMTVLILVGICWRIVLVEHKLKKIIHCVRVICQ